MERDRQMSVPLPKRVAQNAAGDFYVEAGYCLSCCLPHEQAPELMNDPSQPFHECYFRRQPQTPEEIEHAINAMLVSELGVHRYGGTDQRIIDQLRANGSAYLCDHAPEGIEHLEECERVKRPTTPPARTNKDGAQIIGEPPPRDDR